MSEHYQELSQYITLQYLEAIFTGSFIPPAPLADEIRRSVMAPPKGAHLSTPRLVGTYTHHGIYVGDNQVIHFSGLASDFEAGKIEKVSLADFAQGNGFQIIDHDLPTYTSEQIVANAYGQLEQENYNLLWNNCEQFVYNCIFGEAESKQVQRGTTATIIAAGKMTAKTTKKLSQGMQFSAALTDTAKAIKDYLNNKTSGKECIESISGVLISNASVGYYSLLGQATIPIPVVGALIGASAGYIIGNMLLSSGHLSLGESTAVKYARGRREQVEQLCAVLIPAVQKSREQLEAYLATYFAQRHQEIGLALNALEASMDMPELEQFSAALETLNKTLGQTLKIKSFAEFDNLMLSDEEFAF